MLQVGKQMVSLLAKISPVIGGFVILSSFQASSSSPGPWVELWRIAMSVALGVFVALVGAIYQNINRRLETVEATVRTIQREAGCNFVSRSEYDGRHNDVVRQLDRIENALMRASERSS